MKTVTYLRNFLAASGSFGIAFGFGCEQWDAVTFYAKTGPNRSSPITMLSSGVLEMTSPGDCIDQRHTGIKLSFPRGDQKPPTTLISCFVESKEESTEIRPDSLNPNAASANSISAEDKKVISDKVCSTAADRAPKSAFFEALNKEISKMQGEMEKMIPPQEMSCEQGIEQLTRAWQLRLDVSESEGACDFRDLVLFSNLKSALIEASIQQPCTNISSISSRLVVFEMHGGALKAPEFNGESWPNLQELHLEAVIIAPGDLQSLGQVRQLRAISLRSLSLREIPDFSQSYQLQTLDVAHNNIAQIDFNRLPTKLKTLDLLANPLQPLQILNLRARYSSTLTILPPQEPTYLLIK